MTRLVPIFCSLEDKATDNQAEHNRETAQISNRLLDNATCVEVLSSSPGAFVDFRNLRASGSGSRVFLA